MKEYIDKSAVKAALEKFMYEANQEADIASTGECFDEKVADAKYQLCKQIIGSIDSLEVKEVGEPSKDLEKEFDKCCENHIFDDECEVYTARKFFELGLKAQKGE